MLGLLRHIWTLAVLVLLAVGCTASSGVYHTVERGQTLYRIGQVYGVGVDQLARVNRLQDRSQLQVGQKLFVPGASAVRPVPSSVATVNRTAPAPRPRQAAASAAPARAAQQKPSAASPESQLSSAPSPHSVAAPAARGDFIWPVRGSVVKQFAKNGDQANKGIEIAVADGSTVVASAAGKVTYSGDGIKGYGNLIILRHDNTFFTVYGFNKKNLVQSGSFVSQGQSIALAGQPPAGGSARLHFEIRRGREAVNPLGLLP